jgi:uncharacterized protein YneF (UPF0154 family)
MLPIVGIIVIIGIILFIIFAAKKKSKGKDLGERPPINSDQ